MHIIVTGGLGFIGSNFIRKILSERPSWRVTNLDKMTYAGNPASLQDVAAIPPTASSRPTSATAP